MDKFQEELGKLAAKLPQWKDKVCVNLKVVISKSFYAKGMLSHLRFCHGWLLKMSLQ